jgi:hypothetical protein
MLQADFLAKESGSLRAFSNTQLTARLLPDYPVVTAAIRDSRPSFGSSPFNNQPRIYSSSISETQKRGNYVRLSRAPNERQ